MTAGVAGTILFLTITAIAIIGLWRATKPDPDPPDGVTITYVHRLGWNYYSDRPGAMFGTGYLTRGGALRAARDEHQRLEQRNTQA